jgi:hypothetical protein
MSAAASFGPFAFTAFSKLRPVRDMYLTAFYLPGAFAVVSAGIFIAMLVTHPY